ncbi:acetyl-CoA carboxylase biotin carboxyl carrier protein [Liberiplasma polymorphum]|uniref:acetyl-CoA carboxylase biotin carboxyl carrier protein n=1 Tax=Liberiplasma polymorphum TaxID=3374570 RepID=UPI003774F643
MNNKELKELIKIFESSSLSRIKLDKGDVTIELEKQSVQVKEVVRAEVPAQQVVANEANTPVTPAKPTYEPLKAPLVGTYYEAPAPDQPSFVRIGQNIKKGDTLFIIEAMKVMNEITAPRDGKIMSINVKNGDMVMYDQIIMEIE